ncbi:MAG: vanadium-dependent haloperoxidase [Chitinophagaceae bacterium]|nr:vanadium-dependent haloperoxidase [Chitinophagaceae bacterium]
MKKLIIIIIIVLEISSGFAQKKEFFTTNDYIRALKSTTDIMINDVTSPVAASRYYAYICLAANQMAALFNRQQPDFINIAHGLNTIIADDSMVKKSDPGLAVTLSLYKSGIKLLPSGYLLKPHIDSLLLIAKSKKMADEKIKASAALADNVIMQITRYASADGFTRLSGIRRYTPLTGDEFWQPTAPGFMAAIEPYWQTLRTFIIDSCSQFACGPPDPYSTDTASAFYKGLYEVYTIGKNLSKEQADIAMFWDCNPFALQQVGHLEFGVKKISPGGHWMGIAGIACKKKKLDIFKTTYIHAIVAVSLADAFISCWYGKYKYNRVRPVTAINRLIDHHWSPLLQTPPFPEYTSGHSVISATASIVLTHVLGDGFSFTDDTEVEFGLPKRNFDSFINASKEAGISRLYGGIHYRDAIDIGLKEGEQIGKFIVARCINMQAKQ